MVAFTLSGSGGCCLDYIVAIFIYREIKFKDLKRIFVNAALGSTVLCFLLPQHLYLAGS